MFDSAAAMNGGFMIKNERAYRITKVEADRFRTAIAEATDAWRPKNVHPRLYKEAIDALRVKLKQLERELTDYTDLQAGRVSLTADADTLGALLIRGRIARRLTQKELAERLGVHMQQVQQYEATEYERASLARVREVFQALGLELDVRGSLLEYPPGFADIGAVERKRPERAPRLTHAAVRTRRRNRR